MSADMPDTRIDPEELRDAAQKLLAAKADRRAPWQDGATANGATLEREMTELGWYMLTVPEAQGGLGQDFTALAPLYEELGRALSPVWFAETMAAVDVLSADGSDAALAVLGQVTEHGARVAIATVPNVTSSLTATLALVPAAADCTHLLLLPEGDGRCGLVDLRDAGMAITPIKTWDLGRDYIQVVCTGAPVIVLDGAGAAMARAHRELALAWDCIGAARQCLAETVEYMLGRQQFGRPVASFQALKHRAADHRVAIDLARALVVQASTVFAARGEAWQQLASQALLLAGEAFSAMGEDAVQLHGGVGFTWEYNCHLFLKRALMNQIVLGSPEARRDRVAGAVIQRALMAG